LGVHERTQGREGTHDPVLLTDWAISGKKGGE
jgi:hypothetical protein